MKFKASGLIACVAFMVAMSFGPIANGQVAISIIDPTISIGPDEQLFLTATGTDLVSNLNLVAVVDNNAVSDPSIVSVTGLGFFDGVQPAVPLPGAGGTPQAVIQSFNGGAGSSLDLQDFLAIGFDTTNLSAGDTFDLALDFTLPGGQLLATGFANDTAGTPAAVTTNFPSSFRITVVDAVPEPSSLVLLLASGSLAFLRRRKL